MVNVCRLPRLCENVKIFKIKMHQTVKNSKSQTFLIIQLTCDPFSRREFTQTKRENAKHNARKSKLNNFNNLTLNRQVCARLLNMVKAVHQI